MATDQAVAFRDALLDAGVLVRSSVEGVFGRGPAYSAVFDGLDRLWLSSAAHHDPVDIRFPPVLPRAMIEATDYVQSFPQLLGTVHSFDGDDKEHREIVEALESGRDWTHGLPAADVVLAPAACYPLYPLSTGQLPDGGRHYTVIAWCFRHEPSPDPARMQSFQMREVVHLGTAESAQAFRDDWIDRTLELYSSLGLEVDHVVANDPFFGRAGRMLASGQRSETLKFEIVTPIVTENPTAITSCNCHRDHFGLPFDIRSADGEVAHSACVGVGVDRAVLALFHRHGTDPSTWPTAVKDRLTL